MLERREVELAGLHIGRNYQTEVTPNHHIRRISLPSEVKERSRSILGGYIVLPTNDPDEIETGKVVRYTTDT